MNNTGHQTLWGILATCAGASLAAVDRWLADDTSPDPEALIIKPGLYTAEYRNLLSTLQTINIEGVTVATKVRLSDLFTIKLGQGRKQQRRIAKRISDCTIDYVLLRNDDGKPMLGIKLDLFAPENDCLIYRDDFIDQAFAANEIPLLKLGPQAHYDPEELRGRLFPLLYPIDQLIEA